MRMNFLVVLGIHLKLKPSHYDKYLYPFSFANNFWKMTVECRKISKFGKQTGKQQKHLQQQNRINFINSN